MKKLTAAAKLVLADLSQLNKPAVASGIAGVLVPIVAAVAGVDVTAAEVGGWLVLAGGVAATFQKLETVKAAPPVVKPPVKLGK